LESSNSTYFTNGGFSMKRIVCAIIGAAFILAGCNTMAGLGEDTQAAGKKVENSAEKNKRY